MKSEQEVRDKINATIKTLIDYHEAYNKRNIPFDVMAEKTNECNLIIGVLKWVLGENDSFTN